MTTKSKEEKKVLTSAEIAEVLNDPTVLQAALGKLQQSGAINQPQPAKAEPKKVKELKYPEPVEISEEATTKDIVEAMNKHDKEVREYYEAKSKQDINAIRSEQDSNNQLQAARTTQTFFNQKGKEKYKTDQTFLREMDVFVRAGADLETAFNKTLKVLDIKEEKEEEKKANDNTQSSGSTSNSSANNVSSSEEDGSDKKKLESYDGDTKKAAQSALDSVLEANPELKDAVNEGI